MKDQVMIIQQWPHLLKFWHIFSTSAPISFGWCLINIIGVYAFMYPNLLHLPLVSHPDTNIVSHVVLMIYKHLSFWDFIPIRHKLILFLGFYMILIIGFVSAMYLPGLMFKRSFIYYLRVSLEVGLPIFMIITLQNIYPVVDLYRNKELNIIYLVIFFFNVILSVTLYTIYNFLSGQSIYVPTNFLAIWDTWNMYSKYIFPPLIPSILLINNTPIRNSLYCLLFAIAASSNIILDINLPYLSRSSSLFYFILEQMILALSIIAFFILFWDQSFEVFLVIYIPISIIIILNIGNFYNKCTKRMDDYLKPKINEPIDIKTGFPLRFLEDTFIIHVLRYLASNDGEKATKLAHFLMTNATNKRIHIEGIRILIILEQKNEDVANRLFQMTIKDIPWYMAQCLCDSQFEAIAYLSKFILFDSVKRDYISFENIIKSNVASVIDKIIEEDFDGCYNKAIDYLNSCEKLEIFISQCLTVVPGCTEFYEEVAKYYNSLRGDPIKSETYKYRSTYVSDENKKIKAKISKIEQSDMNHFISYRSRITSLASPDFAQNPKHRIQAAVDKLESNSVKKSKRYQRVILLVSILSTFFFLFSITMIRGKRDHTLLIHKILMSRMVPLYKLAYKLAILTNNNQTNFFPNKAIYEKGNLRKFIDEISLLFSDIEDVFILSKKYFKTYEIIVSEEKKYQIQMYQIAKILENGIQNYEINYLYNIVHDVDQSIEKFIDCIMVVRRAMDQVYLHFCLLIPLINISISIFCVIVIFHKLNYDFKKEILLFWNILLEKDFTSLLKYRNILMYSEFDDILLSDDEIEEDNVQKIQITNNKKNIFEINYFGILSLIIIILLVLTIIIYEYVINEIIANDFVRNRSSFTQNRLFQNLFVIATDVMMYELMKDDNNTQINENLHNNLELADKRDSIQTESCYREGILDYLVTYYNWYRNGKKQDDLYIDIVKESFKRAEFLIYFHFVSIKERIERSIQHMTYDAYFMLCFFYLIAFVYSIFYYWQLNAKSKLFKSLKALIQILPSQHITPQSQLLMAFSNDAQQEKKFIQNKVVVKNYPDAFFTVTSEGTIEGVNKSMENLIKIDRHLIIGHKASDLIEDLEIFLSRNKKKNVQYFNSYLKCEEKIPITITVMFVEQKVGIIVKDRRNELERANHLRAAKIKVENLLSKILPRQMKIKILGKQQKLYSQVERSTITFIGISDFLGWCKIHNHLEIMELLDVIFTGFDERINKYPSLTKLKTINGTYMVASGLFESKANQELESVAFCVECAEEVRKRNKMKKVFEVSLNIGINTGGPIITGILGDELPMFDIWGDAVNVASRLETSCPTSFIQLSEETKASLPEGVYDLIPAKVNLKGKGLTTAYRIPI